MEDKPPAPTGDAGKASEASTEETMEKDGTHDGSDVDETKEKESTANDAGNNADHANASASADTSAEVDRQSSGESTIGKRRFPPHATGYELIDQIGTSQSATVYRAWCPEMEEEVAIKVLDLEVLQAPLDEMRKEIQIMSMSHHENVVPYSTSFLQGNDLWVVMPLLTGGSVLGFITCTQPNGLREDLAKYILHSTLKALDYFHSNGQIHRDVRAANIMFNANGKVMLSDYGMMGWAPEGTWERKQRQTFIGTPCWMAPEVLEQSKGYDFKADVWSLGITALEIAQGKAPYSEFPPAKVLVLTLKKPAPTLDDSVKDRFSDEYKELVELCLQKDPQNRPTAKELLAHKLFDDVKMPDYLPDMLADLPPLGSRGSKHANLIREMKKIQDPPRSGIWEIKKQGKGWNFGDEDDSWGAWSSPGKQPKEGIDTAAGVDMKRDADGLSRNDSAPSSDGLARDYSGKLGSSGGIGSDVLTAIDSTNAQVLSHIRHSSAAEPTDNPSLNSHRRSPGMGERVRDTETSMNSSRTVSAKSNDGSTKGVEDSSTNTTTQSGLVLEGALPPPMSFSEKHEEALAAQKTGNNMSKGRFIVSDVDFGKKIDDKLDHFIDADDDEDEDATKVKSTPSSLGAKPIPNSSSVGSIRSVGKSDGSPDPSDPALPRSDAGASGASHKSVDGKPSRSRRKFEVSDVEVPPPDKSGSNRDSIPSAAPETMLDPALLSSVAAAAVAEHHVRASMNPPRTPVSPTHRNAMSFDQGLPDFSKPTASSITRTDARVSTESLPSTLPASGTRPPPPPPKLSMTVPASVVHAAAKKAPRVPRIPKNRFEVKDLPEREVLESELRSGSRSGSARSRSDHSATASFQSGKNAKSSRHSEWSSQHRDSSYDANTEVSPSEMYRSYPSRALTRSGESARRTPSISVHALGVLSNLQQLVTSLVARNEELEGRNDDLELENEQLKVELRSLREATKKQTIR